MAMPDAIKALIDYLKNDSDTAALVGTRVFSPQMPGKEAEKQARKSVVIGISGGASQSRTGSADNVPQRTLRHDLFCYGNNPEEADEVYRAVHSAMKKMTDTNPTPAPFRNAVLESGPRFLVDADFGWPMMVETWLVTSSELATA